MKLLHERLREWAGSPHPMRDAYINDQCGSINMVALQDYLERAMKLGESA